MKPGGDGRHPEVVASGKDRFEEILHILPGASVRLFTVCQRQPVLFTVGIGLGIGESVHGAGIGDKSKIGPGRLHLVGECRHLVLGYQNIVGTVTNQDLRKYATGSGLVRRTQRPVKTDHTG